MGADDRQYYRVNVAKNLSEGAIPQEYLDRPIDDFPPLSAATRELLKDKLKSDAMKACDEEAKNFVNCTKDKYISVLWACRPMLRGFNMCLKQHTTAENYDLLVRRYWADRDRVEHEQYEKAIHDKND